MLLPSPDGPFPYRNPRIYVFPTTRHEVYLRSEVQMNILIKLEKILREILPGGRVSGKKYCAGDFEVSLSGHCIPGSCLWLNRGAWLHRPSSTLGVDLIELQASRSGHSYQDIADAFAAYFGIDGKKSHTEQRGLLPGWTHQRNPLYGSCGTELDVNLVLQYAGINRAFYKNQIGEIISIVDQWALPDGSRIKIYTLLCKKKPSKIFWLDLFPANPFMLYNADRIYFDKLAEIVFVDDEFLADDLAMRYPTETFTTIPGGIANFLHADMREIKGRRVRVILRLEDLRRKKSIYQKLLKAGVLDACFSVGLEGAVMRFDNPVGAIA